MYVRFGDEKIYKYIIIILIIGFCFSLIDRLLFNKKENFKTIYLKKNLMTDSEYNFYLKLKDLEIKYNYKIIPQINLASIIKKIIIHIIILIYLEMLILPYSLLIIKKF